MQKKALMIASMASMIDNFNRNNIQVLEKLGYQVDIAANFETEDSNSYEKVQMFRQEMEKSGHKVSHIDFSRKLSNIKKQIRSIKQVRSLSGNDYDLVHCHSPICSIIVRLVFRKKKAKVIYTAHGFHFYKGAPLKNWIVYYPIEKFCSRFTDVLITINHEDYERAKKRMNAKRVEYVPGVGIDISKFYNFVLSTEEKQRKKQLLSICENEKVFLSVGELSKRKNHEVVIEALSHIHDKNYKYFIAGKGSYEHRLSVLIDQKGLKDNVILLGYRTDVAELYLLADLFIFPSLQEGLPVALMEAVASKIPIICSSIRGNKELVSEKSLFSPHNVSEIKERFESYFKGELFEDIEINFLNLRKYEKSVVSNQMTDLYSSVILS